jgi:hypothetical protein
LHPLTRGLGNSCDGLSFFPPSNNIAYPTTDQKIIPVVSKYWSRRWRYLDDFAGPNHVRTFLSVSTVSTISLFRSRLDPIRLTDRICNHGGKKKNSYLTTNCRRSAVLQQRQKVLSASINDGVAAAHHQSLKSVA